MAAFDDEITSEPYLVYLDKEMSIMGILSGFCTAAFALSLNLWAAKGSSRVDQLTAAGPLSLSLGALMLLFAALAFYRERSLLAWYYGQISLCACGYETRWSLREWLRDADGWDTWMNYQRGFWLLGGAFWEIAIAVTTVFLKPSSQKPMDLWGGSVVAAVSIVAITLQKWILEMWPQVEDPYATFRKDPLSIFKKKPKA